MKKTLVANTMLVAMFAFSGLASANTDDVSGEMPIDTGIVIDTASSAVEVSPTVIEADITDATSAETTDTSTADGTVLPLDAGDVNTVETGTTEAAVTEPVQPTVAPDKDRVVLSEKQPVVEPLPKTGIADNALLYSALALLLGAVAFVTTRRTKAQ